jgi:hypothetical protein
MVEFIKPNWPAPPNITTFTTTRIGGVSIGQYRGLNLGITTNDNKDNINKNINLLKQYINLPSDPLWLNQQHTNIVINEDQYDSKLASDGIYINTPNVVGAVLTADCLPITLCNTAGTEIAVIHCGWKSLAANIIQETLKHFKSPSKDILAWLGPAIGREKFEVGEDVRSQFILLNNKLGQHFKVLQKEKFLADLYGISKTELSCYGVNNVFGGDLCTYSDTNKFYSYRRDGITGRQATVIWM